MEGLETQPHIHLTKNDIHPVCLTVGDPARAAKLAGMCDSHRALAYNREYRSFSCEHKGQKFLVISHGVGAAGASICFEELMELGAQVVIRAGTGGSLQVDSIRQGDVIICHSAGKEDGVTALLEPQGMPAVTDFGVFKALNDAADQLSITVKQGTTVSTDLFYKPRVLSSTLHLWRDAKVDVIEMEASALFVIARHRGRKAGCILSIDGSPFEWSSGDYDPQGTLVDTAKNNMLKIAMLACSNLAREYADKENKA